MTKTNKILRWTIGVVSVLSLAISFYVFSKCTDVIDKSRKKEADEVKCRIHFLCVNECLPSISLMKII